MKRINPPENDDVQELIELSENRRLSSYPELRENRELILSQYELYESVRADPWRINTCNLSENLQGRLKLHYKSEIRNNLEFLDVYRDKISPNLCLMCGGLGMGTLDHYLPKDDYAEFSIFSKNLVPACSCNTSRSTNVMGSETPQRAIHPYYDDFLNERLYQSVFTGDFLTPSISVDIINNDHQNIEILRFHLDEVIKKNNIIGWFEKIWQDLTDRGDDILDLVLVDQTIDASNLSSSIQRWIRAKDKEYDTPNNWYSFFYQGLLSDDSRLDELADKINELRNQ